MNVEPSSCFSSRETSAYMISVSATTITCFPRRPSCPSGTQIPMPNGLMSFTATYIFSCVSQITTTPFVLYSTLDISLLSSMSTPCFYHFCPDCPVQAELSVSDRLHYSKISCTSSRFPSPVRSKVTPLSAWLISVVASTQSSPF